MIEFSTTPDPTGLIYRSSEAGPGLHVFLVGVSDYPFLGGGEKEQQDNRGLGQVDSAARTVWEAAQWLGEASPRLGHPLRTCRLLASPSPAELLTAPPLATMLSATRANFVAAASAWRKDAATSRDGAALFYFAGHGIQRTRGDSLLLLSDFLQSTDATLANTVDLSCVYDGMGEPKFADMAQTQYFFVDACRTDLPGVAQLADRSAPAIWDVTMGGKDDRVAPIFYGAGSGQTAYGSLTPGGISAFGTDLLAALRGAAAELIRGTDGMARWTVTIAALTNSLRQLVKLANPPSGPKLRSFVLDKWTEVDATLVELEGAPRVKCMLELAPADTAGFASVHLARPGAGGQSYDLAGITNPHPFEVEAGGYILRAVVPNDFQPCYPAVEEAVTVLPPRFVYPLCFRL